MLTIIAIEEFRDGRGRRLDLLRFSNPPNSEERKRLEMQEGGGMRGHEIGQQSRSAFPGRNYQNLQRVSAAQRNQRLKVDDIRSVENKLSILIHKGLS